MKKYSLSFPSLLLASALPCLALDPGDVMIVGYTSNTLDTLSFVTWVELAPNETLLLMDGEYDGGGDGTGEGIGGGRF